MVDATISRARLRGLARLGRVRNRRAPGTDDLMASTI